jgi:predicted SprT family Zn-dependent metalloprotease
MLVRAAEPLPGWDTRGNPRNFLKSQEGSGVLIVNLPPEYLQATWAELNRRYFRNALPPIRIVWSSRLTASMGLFYSRVGPRTRVNTDHRTDFDRRVIRLSLPLFRQLHTQHLYGNEELIGTLAHEMIHQWQYDILKRRPDHGADFRRTMRRMNQDGLRITVYHSLHQEVDAFARYVWRCQQCGYLYRRQRRTIQPRRHQCGACRGSLREVKLSDAGRRSSSPPLRYGTGRGMARTSEQLVLDFSP